MELLIVYGAEKYGNGITDSVESGEVRQWNY
jgi:hypothetical protein